LRTTLLTVGAAVLASGVAVAATAGTGHASQPTQPSQPFGPGSGISTLHLPVNLPTGVWVTTPLAVHLPGPGTYAIDANVRGRLEATPSVDTYITARLWDDTRHMPLFDSERLVYQLVDFNTLSQPIGGNETAPIDELVTVNRPTTIRLQAVDETTNGTAGIAQIYSDSDGYTTLRYVQVAP
jgi:hypothetical protein